MRKIAVLGGGIIGHTCAIALRLAGCEVNMYGRSLFTDKSATSDPKFASAYPAASIIPHSIRGKSIITFAKRSALVFDQLSKISYTGVRSQLHYELFEVPFAEPAHKSLLRNYRSISNLENHVVPARTRDVPVSGFAFDCYFCDMSKYGPWLTATAESLGVSFVSVEIDKTVLLNLDAEHVVNCLGAGAPGLFQDLEEGVFHKGLLLKCKFSEPPVPVSYNYTPLKSIYSYANGDPADIYYYPRDGHCILGGTRLELKYCKKQSVYRELIGINSETIEFCGVKIPSPIWDLNCRLVHQLTGRVPTEPFEALVGYRFQGGTSLSPEFIVGSAKNIGSMRRTDCFGFGGAGVCLSWGAALEVVRHALHGKDPPSDSILCEALSNLPLVDASV